ncbi:hypothetical protein Z042_23705 [Chania multitudinisentens RB-25]|uniref:Uncharacterized protein n=1 Tax=Chania multitudinisentens RB-25 TaxID=1441930 RepID=W0LLT4_9GAMM|nr:hypothetical protein Z042_23705 [Chania multitudinisentens RB-25]
MGQSLQGVIGQEKGVGANRLTSQTCSFYACINAAVGHATPCGPSGGTGVDVRLGLKDGRGSSAAVLAPLGRYVPPFVVSTSAALVQIAA